MFVGWEWLVVVRGGWWDRGEGVEGENGGVFCWGGDWVFRDGGGERGNG